MRRSGHETEPGRFGHAGGQPPIADANAHRGAVHSWSHAIPDGLTDPQSTDAEPDRGATVTVTDTGSDDDRPSVLPAG
jgi:hypothetical protein